MRKYDNLIVVIAFFALVFGVCQICGFKTSYALPTDWYTDYTYDLDNGNKTITLKKYNGTAGEIVIPATASINSQNYQVIISGNSPYSNSLFSSNETITKVTVENGVQAASSLRGLFSSCTNLKEVNLNNLDTSNVTDFAYMFNNCKSIETLDLHQFNTSSATIMTSMFSNCTKLTTLNIGNFDTRNLTGFSNFLHVDSALKTLTIGPYTYFYATGPYTAGNEIKGSAFGRGVWKKQEDGKNYDAVDIAMSNATSKAGTYVKQSNIIEKMTVNYDVTYRIKDVESVSVISADNKFELRENGYINVKNLSVASSSDYTVPGKIVLLAKNAAMDRNGQNYDMRITISNVHLYDINTNVGYDNFYARIAKVTNIISFHSYFYGDEDLTIRIYDDSAIKEDVEFEILDQNGNVQEGSYVFTANDLDIASSRDKNSAYPFTAGSSGFGDYSEGINLISGYDAATLKMHPNTNLIKNGNRIFGIHADEDSELSEFTIKTNANSFKFAWTGEGCGTNVLTQYQPLIVNFAKQDSNNHNIAGAVLELYHSNQTTPITSWTTTTDVHKEFLQPGLYVLKEKTTPSGYNKASDISFYVDFNDKLIVNDKTVNLITMTDNYNKYSYVVNYLDKKTNESIHEPKTVSNVNYKTVIESANEVINIENYLYNSVDKESITIDYDETKNVINIYYDKNEGKVTAKYIYIRTQEEILPSETIIDIVGKDYNTIQKEKAGYTFIEVTGNPAGKIQKEETTVIYKYLKSVKLTVNHINKITNKIMDTEVTNSYEGQSYHASSKNYEGFVLVEKPEVESGVFGDEDIVLNYYYNQVSAGVLEKHLDINTNEILYNELHKGNEGDAYDIKSRDFTLNGYKLVQDRLPDNAKGTMKVDLIEVIYYYQKYHNVITKVEGEGGTIVGDEEVPQDGDSTPNKIVIKSLENYEIDSIKINGEEIPITDKHQMILDNFKKMIEDKEVVVSFAKVIADVPKTDRNTTLFTISIPVLIVGIGVVIYSITKKKKILSVNE